MRIIINDIFESIFSNKNRLLKIIICIVILIIMGLYNEYLSKENIITLSECFNNPVENHLKVIKIAQDAKVINVNESRIEVCYRGDNINVQYNKYKTDLLNSEIIGEKISMKTIFHKEGYLELERFHVHKNRVWKVVLSLLTSIVFFILFIKKFKFNIKEFVFEDRKCRI